MVRVLVLVAVSLFGCQMAAPPPAKDECDALARKYKANVIEMTDFKTGKHEVYARIRDSQMMWKSSKKDTTKTVSASTIREARKLCADLMRPGIEKNPNPPEPDDWLCLIGGW